MNNIELFISLTLKNLVHGTEIHGDKSEQNLQTILGWYAHLGMVEI